MIIVTILFQQALLTLYMKMKQDFKDKLSFP